MPNTETEILTLLKLALISERAQQDPKCQFTSLAHLLNERFLEHCYHRLGRDRASGMDGVTQPVHTVACNVSFTEEPDVGKLQVRFCEGC